MSVDPNCPIHGRKPATGGRRYSRAVYRCTCPKQVPAGLPRSEPKQLPYPERLGYNKIMGYHELYYVGKYGPVYKCSRDTFLTLPPGDYQDFRIVLEEYARIWRDTRKKWYGTDEIKVDSLDHGGWIDLLYAPYVGKAGCADWTNAIVYPLNGVNSQRRGQGHAPLAYGVGDVQIWCTAFPKHHQSALVWPFSQMFTDNFHNCVVYLDPWIMGGPVIYSEKAWQTIVGFLGYDAAYTLPWDQTDPLGDMLERLRSGKLDKGQKLSTINTIRTNPILRKQTRQLLPFLNDLAERDPDHDVRKAAKEAIFDLQRREPSPDAV